MLLRREVATLFCEIQRRISLAVFTLRAVGDEPEAVTIRELANEVRFIAPFRPLRRVAPLQSFSHFNLFPLDDFIEYSNQRAASRVS